MVKDSKPRAGSLQFKPRKRAKKETPRIHSWVTVEETKLLGFAGYKAGMTHVMAIDNNKTSPTYGSEIFIPVTVIETPPLKIAAIRFYEDGYWGKETSTEVWSNEIDPRLRRRVTLPKEIPDPEKKLNQIEENLENFSEIRVLAYTQPYLLATPKKTPDIMEISIGGSSLEEKLNYCKEKLGKEVTIEEIFHEFEYVDVTAVTKGKGYEGVIKRYGTHKQPRKSGQGRRHVGTGGAWTPARKLWREPLPGHLGYNTRTEYNKLVLKIGKNPEEINPKGGFLHYGDVRTQFVLLKGSVPGPAKRLIRLTFPRRKPEKVPSYDIVHISLDSKQ